MRQRTTVIAGTRFPVSDAIMPIIIPIKPKDEKKGVKGDPANCMLALAVNRATGGTKTHVFGTKALVEVEDQLVRYDLPMATRAIIRAFDAGTFHVPHGGVNVLFNRPARRNRLGSNHHATGTGGTRATVPPGARKPRTLVGIRGGFSSYRSTADKSTP